MLSIRDIMRKEKEYLLKLRYLYMLRNEKNLGFVSNDIDFKNKYFKDKEEFMMKFIGIK